MTSRVFRQPWTCSEPSFPITSATMLICFCCFIPPPTSFLGGDRSQFAIQLSINHTILQSLLLEFWEYGYTPHLAWLKYSDCLSCQALPDWRSLEPCGAAVVRRPEKIGIWSWLGLRLGPLRSPQWWADEEQLGEPARRKAFMVFHRLCVDPSIPPARLEDLTIFKIHKQQHPVRPGSHNTRYDSCLPTDALLTWPFP